MTHDAAHCLDLNVATATATGAVVDFCYDCDDFVTRVNGVIVGTDADECRHNRLAAISSRACCATPDNAVHVCHLCGKRDDRPHTNETRKVHMDHIARYGWSGMCASPDVR